LTARALKQAGRELLLAQASDWPSSCAPAPAPTQRSAGPRDQPARFIALHEQLTTTTQVDAACCKDRFLDNLFPDIDYLYWG